MPSPISAGNSPLESVQAPPGRRRRGSPVLLALSQSKVREAFEQCCPTSVCSGSRAGFRFRHGARLRSARQSGTSSRSLVYSLTFELQVATYRIFCRAADRPNAKARMADTSYSGSGQQVRSLSSAFVVTDEAARLFRSPPASSNP